MSIISLLFNLFTFNMCLAYFIVRIQYVINIAYKTCTNQLFVINKAISSYVFGVSKAIHKFLMVQGLTYLTPALFEGQLYYYMLKLCKYLSISISQILQTSQLI